MTGEADRSAGEGTGQKPDADRLDARRLLLAVVRCVRFYSRLPTPKLGFETDKHAAPDFRTEPAGLPVAALIIALPGMAMLALAVWLRLDPLLSTALALAVMVVATGAFHEDGLGDTADGLFGGLTPERRLEIMKDSRIGAFAGVAIMLSLLLRIAALAAVLRGGGLDAALGAMAIAAMVSRVDGIRLLATLPVARAYGASAAVGQPPVGIALVAIGLTLVLIVPIWLISGLPLLGVLLGIGLSTLAVSLIASLARRLIGGQTGDIAGAAQQLSEIAIYLGLAIALAR